MTDEELTDDLAFDAAVEIVDPPRRPSHPEKVPSSPEEAEQAVLDASYAIAAFLDVVFKCEKEAKEAREKYDRQYNLRYDHHQSNGAPAHACKVRALIDVFELRAEAEKLENVFAHAQRVLRWREKDLLARQTVASSIRSTFGPASSGYGR
jgi:hypothetical protein